MPEDGEGANYVGETGAHNKSKMSGVQVLVNEYQGYRWGLLAVMDTVGAGYCLAENKEVPFFTTVY